MNFKTLKQFHLCHIQISLDTGEIYEGMITSHSFKDGKMEEISSISLMNDRSIVSIDCNRIVNIGMLEKRKSIA